MHTVLASFRWFHLFVIYMFVSIGVLALFSRLYMRLTPYDDLDHIRHGDVGAAVALGGAIIGFALPIRASVLHGDHILDTLIWAMLSCLFQVISYIVLREVVRCPQEQSSGVFVGLVAVAVGLITSACMVP